MFFLENLPLLLWFLHSSLLSWKQQVANVAEIIKLIIRDESVHGTYIGYKFQLGFNELPEDEQEKIKRLDVRPSLHTLRK